MRKANIEAFLTDPEVAVVVCPHRAGVGLNLQVASNVVLAELFDPGGADAGHRLVYRIGQTEPVTAWRIIATQTIDPRLAQLIDDKAGPRLRPWTAPMRTSAFGRRAARGAHLPAGIEALRHRRSGRRRTARAGVTRRGDASVSRQARPR